MKEALKELLDEIFENRMEPIQFKREPSMLDNPGINRIILELKDRIEKNFGESNWRELGLLINEYKYIDEHHRLLRSMSWRDEDYAGHIIDFLQRIATKDLDNLNKVMGYLNKKYPDDSGEFISSENKGKKKIVFSPIVFEVPEVPVNENLVSVMMPFEAKFDDVYKTIQKAVTSNGFECKRAENIWEHSTIIQNVFQLIFQSYIVVCDFSERNPNVFYEAGIAHTLGKHVVPLAQAKSDIPFDLQHHRYIPYHDNSEGRKSLQQALSERLAILAAKRANF